MTTKIDLTHDLHHLYAAPRDPVLIDVPEMAFLMIDGRGDPNTSPAYAAAIKALYGLAYTIKFTLKRHEGVDFGVAPLEGLWWTPDMAAFTTTSKDKWFWTMMIMQPDVVTVDVVEDARVKAATKKDASAALERVRLEPFCEGRAAQVMHIGPYAAERPTIERLHSYIAGQGLVPAGKHHEIYLGDPRRAAPEKLKTIIRQPVGPAVPFS